MDQVYFTEFLDGYIRCALWSSTDGKTASGGEPLDKNYSAKDLSSKTNVQMSKDCRDFIQQHEGLLKQAAELGRGAEDCGIDFWLTRNGHGAGFWDRGLGDVGDMLTAAAKKFGEAHLFVFKSKIRHYA